MCDPLGHLWKIKIKQLTKWILKKQKKKMPWGKLVCAVAAKLLRIVRAILISSKPYNPKIAGGREMLIVQRELKI